MFLFSLYSKTLISIKMIVDYSCYVYWPMYNNNNIFNFNYQVTQSLCFTISYYEYSRFSNSTKFDYYFNSKLIIKCYQWVNSSFSFCHYDVKKIATKIYKSTQY